MTCLILHFLNLLLCLVPASTAAMHSAWTSWSRALRALRPLHRARRAMVAPAQRFAAA